MFNASIMLDSPVLSISPSHLAGELLDLHFGDAMAWDNYQSQIAGCHVQRYVAAIRLRHCLCSLFLTWWTIFIGVRQYDIFILESREKEETQKN